MIYVKSALVGLLVVFGAFVPMLFAVAAYLSTVHKVQTETIAWDPVSLTTPSTWLLALIIFLGGFLWEFRRCRSK
jgi:hypothetical protein